MTGTTDAPARDLGPIDAPAREPEEDVERPPRRDPGRRNTPIEEPPQGATDDPDPVDDPAPIDEPDGRNDGQDVDIFKE